MATPLPPIQFQEIADKKVTASLEKMTTWIIAIARFLKENNLDLPDVFSVKGSVDVRSLPDIKIANFADLSQSFLAIEQQLRLLSATLPSLKTEDTSQRDFDMLARTMSKGLTSLERAIGMATVKMGEERVITVTPETNQSEIAETMKNVEGLLHKMYEMDVNRPQMVPPPVTNISINPLRGVTLASDVTVTTTATLLPATALANRRSIIAYNNDASKVLYIGGIGVTTALGFPIAAGVYSPPIDAGPNMLVYGISTGSIDVRVLEVSNSNVGG